MRGVLRPVIIGPVALLLIGALGACSALLDFWQCETSADCQDREWCTDDQLCSSLLTENCEEILGTYTSDGVMLGALLSLSGRSQESGDDARRAIQLAVEEINEAGGIGGSQGGRSLSVLVCDDGGDPAQGVREASYLTQEVGVPAVIGPLFSRVAIEVAETVILPGGEAAMVSPSATAVSLTNGAQDPSNLVWRTATNDSYQADTMAFLADWVASERLVASGAEEVTVALLYASDAYGVGLSSLFNQALSVGKPPCRSSPTTPRTWPPTRRR